MGKIGVEGDAVALGSSRRVPSQTKVTRPRWTRLVSRAPGSCIGGSPGPPVRAPGWTVWQETSARWPGSGGVRISQRWPSAPPERRSLRPHDADRAALVEAQEL